MTKEITIARILRIFERFPKWGEVDIARSYGEPGYPDPEIGVIIANWNHVPTRFGNWLEAHGFEIEWIDEWVTDPTESKAYRCSPDSYSWTASYIQDEWSDFEIISHARIESDASLRADYIENRLRNDPRKIDVIGLDFTQDGFVKVESEFETGFHPGQTDDPSKILDCVQSAYPDHDVLFQLTSKGQFDIHWVAWVRPKAD